MSFKPAFLFAFAALAGVALVSTSCAPSSPAVAEREIEAFAARRAQGDLDGALAALSGCARSVSNSVAILRAARVAELARMLGDRNSDAAVKMAEKLLKK